VSAPSQDLVSHRHKPWSIFSQMIVVVLIWVEFKLSFHSFVTYNIYIWLFIWLALMMCNWQWWRLFYNYHRSMSTRSDQTCFVYSIDHHTYVVYSIDPLYICCLRNGHIKLMLNTKRTHQTYVVYGRDPSNLCCLLNGLSHLCYLRRDPSSLFVLPNEPIKPIAYIMDTSNLLCLQYGPIKLMLFTEWNHQTYVVYGRDTSNECCLHYGPIKRMLFTIWTHQTYAVDNIDPSDLCCLRNEPIRPNCLQYGHIELMLFTVWSFFIW
jgi:hypothetical protein